METFREIWYSTWPYIDWIFALLVLVFILKWAENLWLYWRRGIYQKNTPMQMYEIKIPRELTKGPAAMEQFFGALYAFGNWPGSNGEKYWDGETTRKNVFELVGINGNVHMFMKVPKFYADAIVAALYSQYNDLEIVACDDYMNSMPRSYDEIDEKGYDMWGNEYNAENNVALIKTYEDFERTGEKSDKRDVDTMSFFVEFVNNMPSDEIIMIQWMIKAALPDWKDKAEKENVKMKEKLKVIVDGKFIGRYMPPSEAERSYMKSVEEKVARDGFKCAIRVVHIAPKANFNYFTGYRNIFGFFTQMNSDWNRFGKNDKIWTKKDWYNWPFLFTGMRLRGAKNDTYREYLKRFTRGSTLVKRLMLYGWTRGLHHHWSYYNTRELATMYHPPTNVIITTGLMDRVESKKVAPPSNLPG